VQQNDLALSIKATQTGVTRISVITDQPAAQDLFDHVIDLPKQDLSGDAEWKIHNRAYFYDLTPYDETVILDADMLFLNGCGPLVELHEQARVPNHYPCKNI